MEHAEPLRQLQDWFARQCDGDWEHDRGIHIGTLDNPGWRIDINLAGTELEDRPLTKSRTERSEHDWIFCSRDDHVYKARCGPLNLDEAIRAFLVWADQS